MLNFNNWLSVNIACLCYSFPQEVADDPCITHDTNDNKVGGIEDSWQPSSKCLLNWSGVLSRMSLK